MRGKLPIANRKRAAMASSALISHLTVTASAPRARAAFGGCADTRLRAQAGKPKSGHPIGCPLFIGKNLLADLDQIRARLHGAGGHDLDVLEIIGVRDDGNHHGGVSGSRDFVQIHLQQQIALLDLVALP